MKTESPRFIKMFQALPEGMLDCKPHEGSYIRPMGGKVPAIYGLSGDEGMAP